MNFLPFQIRCLHYPDYATITFISFVVSVFTVILKQPLLLPLKTWLLHSLYYSLFKFLIGMCHCREFSNPVTSLQSLLSTLVWDDQAHWIQASVTYKVLTTTRLISAPPHHRLTFPQHSLFITCNSHSSTFVVFCTNNWLLFLICFNLSLEPAFSFTSSTSSYL